MYEKFSFLAHFLNSPVKLRKVEMGASLIYLLHFDRVTLRLEYAGRSKCCVRIIARIQKKQLEVGGRSTHSLSILTYR